MPPTNEYNELQKLRASLPVYSYRSDLIKAIQDHPTLVVVGETGSGKTTQIPQYLFEELRSKAENNKDAARSPEKSNGFSSPKAFQLERICVTQPRRIAAITVCKRVCAEADVKIGGEIGYSIRFEDVCSQQTRLRYVTDGILLRELCTDPDLKNYDCVVIDEAHERTLDTDIIIGLVKMAQSNRAKNPLHVVIMSATLNVEKFSDFFGGCPIFTIPGRTFDVAVKHHPSRSLDHLKSSYVDLAVDTALEVHASSPPGDILVFLTGQQEIYRAIHQFTENDLGQGPLKASVVPIYAALEHIDQRQAFEAAPPGYRKIVFATNIAQTSITIPGVVYVIDSGFVKQKTFEPSTGMDGLVVVPISQAASIQRAGRAGRTQSGVVFRLYSKDAFEALEPETVPEIQRSSLLSTVLTMKAIGIRDVVGFDFLDPPQPNHLRTALTKLRQLGAVDESITPLGQQMARLPLSPYLSCALIHSADLSLSCSRPLLAIAAMLSVEDVILQPRSDNSQARQQAIFSRMFADRSGDHLTLYNIFVLGRKADVSRGWCQDHFINHRRLRHADAIHSQLEAIMSKLKLPLLSPPTADKRHEKPSFRLERAPILRALCKGYFLNLARRHPQGKAYYHYGATTRGEERTFFALNLHPTSILNPRYHLGLLDTDADWVIYSQILYTAQCQLRHVSSVDPNWAIPLITKPPIQPDGKESPTKDVPPPPSDSRLAEIEAARQRFLERKKKPRTS
ncbi:hypothetical protein DSO57_1027908 [Entomophthora muscae]|uniref:Uncharacterized protein n=1 Tax=Entomophthora muscae TaxID=34485 RepID=A0ACC2RGB6_9FUNG|nr:hypothetical protein DSO57_1027908 [Entomophthora muscae]